MRRDLTGFMQDGKDGRPLGRLRFLKLDDKQHRHAMCLCYCDPALGCIKGGKEIRTSVRSLMSGHTKSCGCARQRQVFTRQEAGVTQRRCVACRRWLEESSCFNVERKAKPRPRVFNTCKECQKLKQRGISFEFYQAMLQRQNGKCAFPDCSKVPTYIDYDHNCCPKPPLCGKCVRGLLCNSHNTGLGHFSENPSEFLKAIDYLKPHWIGKKHYVVGFLLDICLDKVVLIRKLRPDYQHGKLNGVGGKVGDKIAYETPENAMRREFLEEAGMDIPKWNHFFTLSTEHSVLWFFWATGEVQNAFTNTDEEIGVYGVASIMDASDTMPNIKWLIQMARSFSFGEHAPKFEGQQSSESFEIREVLC